MEEYADVEDQSKKKGADHISPTAKETLGSR